MRHLVKQYGLNKLAFTDNIINMDLFNSLFPEIEKTHEKYEMFFETPARLKRHHLDMLDRVGVRIIQPGIENLHDASLKLLNKKTTSWENIQLLKSCLELGIHIAWNYLVKMPGDKDEWYSEMAEEIPLLMHLQPPKIIARVRFDRFGKYFHERVKYGFQLKPLKIYKYFFPFSETEINKFAYYFEDDLDDSTNAAPGLKSFLDIMAVWCTSVDVENSLSRDNLFPDNYPILQHFDTLESLEIKDTRPCAVNSKHLLMGNERIIYLNCLEKCSTEDVCDRTKIMGKDIDRVEVHEVLEKLVNLKLIFKKDGYYLALSTAKPKATILRADILADGAVDTARYLSDRWAGAIPLEVSTYSKRKVLI
jgi:ribosomal peptide maturation radical SAM protein 1